jgi:hypothetical protein
MRITFAVGRMVGRSSEIVVAAQKDGRNPRPASAGRFVPTVQAPLTSPETVH